MLTHVIAVFSLAALCALWVILQRWLLRRDPTSVCVERGGGCGGCGKDCKSRSS